ARAAIDATKTIPIVMSAVGDPIGSGFVTNLARPGGNVTGISNMAGELGPKRLALFRELVPAAKRIAVLYNPADPVTDPQIRDTKLSAPRLGLEARFFPVKTPADQPEVFQQVLAWRAQGIIWLQGQSGLYEPAAIVLAARHRLPAMVSNQAFVESGGLLTYNADPVDVFRRTAVYVDKILKGAQAGQLPVEQPTQFDLVVNLKTAKSLGIKVPQSLLLQARKVIE
ncbi:MAG: ABC transporter substrate-binding protein, partial [Betaproteobacteria bacterium]|nr:ABC transporter substrate-binding protein [Betaproteobacteria bacterium]